ncbi:predicted protein [Plenodomus lingam JN3]|uniref:Predicted protein n=1 Tax=Leptosphaeria maculans (strain JN3 / isolate v23.1.3 / race Av1-4-5-6-7-8) TaxID=985895 RepID=E4ZS66_LEPMJ|nr:predicted protein [Plenodomus lingam JN3]CBX94246.1 predicted protein [Plenodomus lingam JN3]
MAITGSSMIQPDPANTGSNSVLKDPRRDLDGLDGGNPTTLVLLSMHIAISLPIHPPFPDPLSVGTLYEGPQPRNGAQKPDSANLGTVQGFWNRRSFQRTASDKEQTDAGKLGC